MTNYQCPVCHGAKQLAFFTIMNNSHKVGFVTGEDMEQKIITCEVCHGTGEVDETVHAEIEAFRQSVRSDLRKLIIDDPA